MQALINKMLERLDAITLRERIIVMIAGMILILIAWYTFFAEFAITQGEKSASNLAAATAQLQNLQAKVSQQSRAQDHQIDPQARLTELQNRATTVEGMIQDYAAELISPIEMARLLERVLERRSTLQLRRLRNLGARDLLPPDSPGQNRLYRHGLELELEGPYLAVLAYLEDLENLPWRLYWQVLEIDAEEYPMNRVRIEVATLSLHEEWIGV